MNHVDPDIIHALRVLATDANSQRVLGLKAKYEQRAEQQFETHVALLTDEVARVVPRTNPLFDLVLILAVVRKLERSQREPEFKSYLDEGFPQGW